MEGPTTVLTAQCGQEPPEPARKYSPESFGEEMHFFLKRGKELFKLTIIANGLRLDFYSHVATHQRQKSTLLKSNL